MSFDPAAATKAYIDALGPEALAKAADYTHGSEWLSFWGVVVAGLVTYLFVRLRILDRIDDSVINAFAVVFQLAPKQALLLKDAVLGG